MDIDFSGSDQVHPLGESAPHPSRPPSGALAAPANPRDTTGYRCGLRLASPPDGDLRGRGQLRFLG